MTSAAKQRTTYGLGGEELRRDQYTAEPDPPLQTNTYLDDSKESSNIQLYEMNKGNRRAATNSSDNAGTNEATVRDSEKVSLVRTVPFRSEANPFREDPYGDADSDPDGPETGEVDNNSFPRNPEQESSLVHASPLPHSVENTVSPTLTQLKQRAPFRRMIDNTALFYVPLRLRCDVVAMCRPEILARCPQVLHELNADLFQCLRVLPPSVHGLVKRTKIWINATYRYGPVDEPRTVGHSTAHHHDGWLVWARDKPEKARGVEIYNCFNYCRMRLHWNGAGLILHELCHLIHQLTLPGGLENEVVKEMYKAAKKSFRYDEVLRRDWAGNDCDTDMAYCMVNHKEFFAEISVTYLADGYRDLDGTPPVSIEACSPPLMSPTVIERMKEREDKRRKLSLLEGSGSPPKSKCLRSLSSSCCATDDDTNDEISTEYGRQQLIARVFGSSSVQLLSRLFPRQGRGPPHCNKFFPFTRGQLSKYDPDLMNGMLALWRMIEGWDDHEDNQNCSRLGCLGWKGEGIESSSVWF